MLFGWVWVRWAHSISKLLSVHYINQEPICNAVYRSVTTEMILGHGNNHNPSNGSSRYIIHTQLELSWGLLIPHAAAWQTITEMEVLWGATFFFVIDVMSSSVREKAFCCRMKHNVCMGGCKWAYEGIWSCSFNLKHLIGPTFITSAKEILLFGSDTFTSHLLLMEFFEFISGLSSNYEINSAFRGSSFMLHDVHEKCSLPAVWILITKLSDVRKILYSPA